MSVAAVDRDIGDLSVWPRATGRDHVCWDSNLRRGASGLALCCSARYDSMQSRTAISCVITVGFSASNDCDVQTLSPPAKR